MVAGPILCHVWTCIIFYLQVIYSEKFILISEYWVLERLHRISRAMWFFFSTINKFIIYIYIGTLLILRKVNLLQIGVRNEEYSIF